MIWKEIQDRVRQVFEEQQVRGVDPERDSPQKVHDALAKILKTARESMAGLEALKNTATKLPRKDSLPVRLIPR